jgi:immunity protein 5 of polymorphic toxin system
MAMQGNKGKQSSRYRFIAEHRGGPIKIDTHRKLMQWARECSEHVLSILDLNIDERLVYALQVAKEWQDDNAPTGKAVKASLAAHAAARDADNPVLIAVSRSVGQAVATAHMADHSMEAALYALKALKLAGKSIHEERAWQIRQLQHLPADIAELVLTTMTGKGKSFKL